MSLVCGYDCLGIHIWCVYTVRVMGLRFGGCVLAARHGDCGLQSTRASQGLPVATAPCDNEIQ